MKQWLSIVVLCSLLIACDSPGIKTSTVERGFYYWKSEWNLNQAQLAFLNRMDAEVLYVKYFDVVQGAWDYYPEAEIQFVSEVNLPIVPTVYFTTDVFQNQDSSDIPRMAERIARNIKSIHPYNLELDEIQFDCDWTPSIKDKYFYFLQEIQHYFPDATLSATIRLYQYKYPDIAGVPPVDKGLLMYYNMGSLTAYEEQNSILNNGEGKKYLGFGDYPLKLDIALPNFDWCVHFRKGHFQQICPNFSQEQLSDNSLFSNNRENWYIFKKDTVLNNVYFRFGDELRHESCSKIELLKAAELLKKEIQEENTRILIYDLQPNTLNDYEKLDAVFSVFD